MYDIPFQPQYCGELISERMLNLSPRKILHRRKYRQTGIRQNLQLHWIMDSLQPAVFQKIRWWPHPGTVSWRRLFETAGGVLRFICAGMFVSPSSSYQVETIIERIERKFSERISAFFERKGNTGMGVIQISWIARFFQSLLCSTRKSTSDTTIFTIALLLLFKSFAKTFLRRFSWALNSTETDIQNWEKILGRVQTGIPTRKMKLTLPGFQLKRVVRAS